MRADVALYSRGLSPSREAAKKAIEAGLVRKNGALLKKPSEDVAEGDVLAVSGQVHPYVGRGGLKLERAMELFRVDAEGIVVVDVGASTGGFTDVLLRRGARKVYAVDVGAGQLAPSLREDPRVINMEHTNARYLSPEMFPEIPRLAVMDVSFISVKLILPALFSLLSEEGRAICLIKPQFEAGREALGKRGIIRDEKVWERVLSDICRFAAQHGWAAEHLCTSPIAGGDGNIEFLADFMPNGRAISEDAIREAALSAKRGEGLSL
ncbi:MAG: TlyA family RNA methyltransferase [Christensenellales bacterium]